MCGCASELGKQLGPEYEITGTIMPGSRLQNITELAKNEIAGLSNGDAVIIWGSSNDINCNETRKGLKYLNDFVNQRSKTYDSLIIAHPLQLIISSLTNIKIPTFPLNHCPVGYRIMMHRF
jgi:hypothetical protein